MQKSEFPKMSHYVGFWQIGSHLILPRDISRLKCNLIGKRLHLSHTRAYIYELTVMLSQVMDALAVFQRLMQIKCFIKADDRPRGFCGRLSR